MKAYPEYKSSGIEWLGEIPSHWEKCAFKYFLTQISEVSTSNNKVGLENIESGTGQFNATDSLFEGNGIDFKKGDILYGKLRPYLRKVWIAEFDGNAVGDFFVYRVQKNATEKYVKWLFLSNGFTEIANSSTDGAKMPRVSSDFIRNLEYYLPPLCEQTAIAAYLDEQTTKIDALIAEKQTQVGDLRAYRNSIITETVTRGLNPDAPLRHSGIDWLGDIPEHWKLLKMKHCIEITNGSDPQKDGNIPVYGSGATSFKTCGEYKEGPTVLIGRKGTLHIPHWIEGKYWNVDTAFDTKVKDNYILRYFYYIACSFDYEQYKFQTTLPSMTQSAYENAYIPVPPISEQQEIADYLDEKTAKIDSLVEELEAQLNDLATYKQAVITEAVTGKVDVRHWTSKS